MAVLADLPDDILLEIISSIHRSSDLNSLMLVSHRLHKLVFGSSSLFLSMKYRKLNFGDGAPGYRVLLYATLVSVLNFPERALYVETFYLEWDSASLNNFFEFSDDDATYLMELFFKQRGILEWKRGEAFVCALRERNQEAYVALLLLLLGNLEFLSITMNEEDEWVRWAILNVVSTCSFLPPSLSSGLRSLRQVKIDCDLHIRHWHYTISLKDIAPLLLLPSIDTIEAELIEHRERCVDNDDDFYWKGKHGTSSVSRLSFGFSSINLEALEELLIIPQRLKSFYYGYIIHDRNEDDQPDCDEVKEILKFTDRIKDAYVDCDILVTEYGPGDFY